MLETFEEMMTRTACENYIVFLQRIFRGFSFERVDFYGSFVVGENYGGAQYSQWEMSDFLCISMRTLMEKCTTRSQCNFQRVGYGKISMNI